MTRYGLLAIAHLLVAAPVGADVTVPTPELLKQWKKHCRDCHDDSGRGRPSKAKMLKIEAVLLDLSRPENAQRSRDELLKITREGKDAMPAFKSKLNGPMVEALLDYSMSFMTRPQPGPQKGP